MEVDDTTNTSVNEETLDTDASLEDMDLSFEGLADETEESNDTEETELASEEDTESEEESESDEGEEEVTEPTEEDTQEEETETTEAQDEKKEDDTPSKEEIKRRNDEAAKQRIAERERKAKELRESQAEYLQGATDDQELVLRQLQIDAYNNRVDLNTNKLQSGIDKAIASIDLFRDGSPEVKEELIRSVDDFERMYVKYSQNGDPIEVNGDVYQYLTEKAESIRKLTGVGARQNQKDKATAKSKTFKVPSKTPKEPKVDPDLAAFDEAVARGW